MLFICTHKYMHFRVAYFKAPHEGTNTAPLAAFGWGPDIPARTACEFNLPALEWPDNPSDAAAWVSAWADAFNVERVTKRFYKDYAEQFERLRVAVKSLKGEDQKMFTQALMNRLMFLRFIERKGWLTPPTPGEGGHSKDYLRLLFQAGGYRGKSFYSGRLKKLFFEALAIEGKERSEAVGAVVFLNGGLFEESELDKRVDDLPDSAFAPLLGPEGLLYRYNFTVQESTPLDIEVAVDPEMLGKVFEELVTGRHESGSYYTPRPVVSFMCREALKGYLADATAIDTEKIGVFVDTHDVRGITIDGAKKIAQALDVLRAVDPACGSGAYPREFAEQCFEQIKGFSGYGFPESHAASFALLVYASSWLKRHHPAAFAAALLNSQPMGFYQPAQIVRDAREHGVEVRPVDVNASAWDCTLEANASVQIASDARGVDATRDRLDRGAADGPAIRLGMRLVRGVGEAEANAIVRTVRRAGQYQSVDRLWRASAVRVATLRRLAKADAFASMGLTRQRALWATQPLCDTPLPLFDAIEPAVRRDRSAQEADAALPVQSPESEVIADYHGIGLSLRAHPVSFLRERLDALRVRPNASLADAAATPAGRTVRVAGVVLVRQRPGTASGIVFITVEDETGIANLIVRPNVYDRFRRAARHAKALLCEGKVERQSAVVHVLARSLRSLDQLAPALATASRDFH